LHQYVYRVIKVLLGGIHVAGVIVCLAVSKGFFCLGNHLWDRIGFFLLWILRGCGRLFQWSFR
jgi:hypothetical protein